MAENRAKLRDNLGVDEILFIKRIPYTTEPTPLFEVSLPKPIIRSSLSSEAIGIRYAEMDNPSSLSSLDHRIRLVVRGVADSRGRQPG